jgi:hypothetical protein
MNRHLKKKNRVSRIIFSISILLIIVLVVLLFYHLGFFDSTVKGEKNFQVADECSLVMNNLLHEIKSEDSCRVVCFEECKLRGLDYRGYSFKENENSCHDCFCTCL